MLVCVGVICLAGGGSPAQAAVPGAVSVHKAHQRVTAARRDLARAQARLRAARHVEDATRTYTTRFGPDVGRWVQLARDCGWPSPEWEQLFFVISRESRGQPGVEDYAHSGHIGLLQLAREWYSGVWPILGQGRTFDPYSPRLNLYWGYRIWQAGGWQPWAL